MLFLSSMWSPHFFNRRGREFVPSVTENGAQTGPRTASQTQAAPEIATWRSVDKNDIYDINARLEASRSEEKSYTAIADRFNEKYFQGDTKGEIHGKIVENHQAGNKDVALILVETDDGVFCDVVSNSGALAPGMAVGKDWAKPDGEPYTIQNGIPAPPPPAPPPAPPPPAPPPAPPPPTPPS